MSKGRVIIYILLFVAAITVVLPAHSSLSPMSFGFPVLSMSSTTTALNEANVHAFDVEAASVNFPVFGCNNGAAASGVAFPMLTQSAIQGQTAVTSHFAQNSQFTSYAYPAVGVGVSGIPGFWL